MGFSASEGRHDPWQIVRWLARPRVAPTLASNRRLARRVVEEVLNGGDLTAADELIAAGYVEHSPLPGQGPGLAGLKRALVWFRAAFPDFTMRVEDVLAEGDRVVVRSTATATHRGVFLGLPPTGTRVSWRAIDVIRVAGGQQVEHWGNEEAPALLEHLERRARRRPGCDETADGEQRGGHA